MMNYRQIISVLFILINFGCENKQELTVQDIQGVLKKYDIKAEVDIEKEEDNSYVINFSLKKKYKLVNNDERKEFLLYLTFLLKDKISNTITYYMYVDVDKGKDDFNFLLNRIEINNIKFRSEYIKMLEYCLANFDLNSVYKANNVLEVLKADNESYTVSFYECLEKFSNEKENSNLKYEATKTILFLYDFLMRFYEDDDVTEHDDLKRGYKELANHLSKLWKIQRTDTIEEKRKEYF